MIEQLISDLGKMSGLEWTIILLLALFPIAQILDIRARERRRNWQPKNDPNGIIITEEKLSGWKKRK